MSAVPRVLPFLLAKYGCIAPTPASELPPAEVPAPAPVVSIHSQIGFYRKYTEAILRRFLRCSLEAGKVPSVMGREMFRSKVSSYRMKSFEDIIIFITDVERCLARLDEDEQEIISRITLQEYTVLETAALLDVDPKTVFTRYRQAVDRLSRIFIAVGMLDVDAVRRAQEAENRENSKSASEAEEK